MKRTSTLLVITFIILIIPLNLNHSENKNQEVNISFTPNQKVQIDYTTHTNIKISSDSQLSAIATTESWPGSGTENDPYVIEHFFITAVDVASIQLEHTRSHVIIRENMLSSSTPYSGLGILLYNTSNILVENNIIKSYYITVAVHQSKEIKIIKNTLKDSVSGIISDFLENCIIQENFINGTYEHGLSIASSKSVKISSNTIDYANLGGTDVNTISSSTDIYIYNNSFQEGKTYSFIFYNFTNNQIERNIFSDAYGMIFDSASNNNLVTKNVFQQTDGYNVIIANGKGNIFTLNNFYYPLSSPGYHFAGDLSGNLFFNSNKGNYWELYNGTDANNDGIGDTPYVILSILGSDDYPLMEPYDLALPVISSSPTSLEFKSKDTKLLNFTATDAHPDNFTILDNGTEIITGTWTNGTNSADISMLGTGLHNCEIILYDKAGNSNSFITTIIITASDDLADLLTPENIIILVGAVGAVGVLLILIKKFK